MVVRRDFLNARILYDCAAVNFSLCKSLSTYQYFKTAKRYPASSLNGILDTKRFCALKIFSVIEIKRLQAKLFRDEKTFYILKLSLYYKVYRAHRLNYKNINYKKKHAV